MNNWKCYMGAVLKIIGTTLVFFVAAFVVLVGTLALQHYVGDWAIFCLAGVVVLILVIVAAFVGFETFCDFTLRCMESKGIDPPRWVVEWSTDGPVESSCDK